MKYIWLNKNLLELKEGVLYYNWHNKQDELRLLLMIPENLKQEVLKNTKNNIRSYIWYSMSSDIDRYVKFCGVYVRSKKANRKAKQHLKSFHSGYPMERIHMDILGPVNKSSQEISTYYW